MSNSSGSSDLGGVTDLSLSGSTTDGSPSQIEGSYPSDSGTSSPSRSMKTPPLRFWTKPEAEELAGEVADSPFSFHSRKVAGRICSGQALTSLPLWFNHTFLVPSTATTLAGPYHLPLSLLRFAPLRCQYKTKSPTSYGPLSGLLRRNKALLKLDELSASMNAFLAMLRRSRAKRKRSLAGPSSSAMAKLPTLESAVSDPGNRRDIPKTACSGEYPLTLERLFFALNA